MRRARSQCFPRTPTSASDFHDLMMTVKADVFRKIDNEMFYRGCVNDSTTMIFTVPATLSALRGAESTVLSFDGTFKTAPSIFGQLFMAYAEVNDKVCSIALELFV